MFFNSTYLINYVIIKLFSAVVLMYNIIGAVVILLRVFIAMNQRQPYILQSEIHFRMIPTRKLKHNL